MHKEALAGRQQSACLQEAAFYLSLERAHQDEFKRYLKEGFETNYANILVSPHPSCLLVYTHPPIFVFQHTSMAVSTRLVTWLPARLQGSKGGCPGLKVHICLPATSAATSCQAAAWVQVLLLRLRQACVHPFLCQSRTRKAQDDEDTDDSDAEEPRRSAKAKGRDADGPPLPCTARLPWPASPLSCAMAPFQKLYSG